MRHVRVLIARLMGLFAGEQADEDLREEMEAHLAMETAEYVRRGMSLKEARRKALLSAGGLTQGADAVRDQRGLPMISTFAADVRYAVRGLRLNPGFSTVVVLTLALGIGANTAIFSVVRGVLLKPLPHQEGERLLYLRHSTDVPGGSDMGFSVPEVRDLRAGVASLEGVAEYSPWSMILQEDDGAVRLTTGLVTGNYFGVMGLAPVLGRMIGPSDDGPTADRVMVLTNDYWMTRFGGDPTILGRQLRLDGHPVTVVGVVQPAPFHPAPIDALLNMVNSDHHLSAMMVEGRSHRMTEVVARVKPGATVEQARLEIQAVYARMQRDHPEAYDAASHPRVAAIPFRELMGERARLTLWLLVGAAAFVLIISVASVANLTLMRAVRRRHELVVRATLGAGVARLRRLLLTENLVLAFLGAALGLAIASGGLRLLVSLVERYSPRATEIRLDEPVLGFMVVLSVVVALLLSILVHLPREGTLAAHIVEGGHRISGSLSRYRIQRVLVIVQVAVSVVLLAGAGLLTRTMIRLSEVETGLATDEILTLQVPLMTPSELMSNPAADVGAKQRYEEMRSEMARLPGVIAAGVGSPGPLRRSTVRFDVKAESRPLPPGQAMPNAELRTASPEFFEAAGIPLVRGRAFTNTDRQGSELVVIINQTLAERLFPGEDPIGRRIAWTGEVLRFAPISGEWRTVVGVAGTTQDGGLDTAPDPAVFLPFAQTLALGGSLVIRASSNVAALVPEATRIVHRIAPAAPLENVQTIAQIRDQSVSPRRLNAALLSSFGILAVLIAAVGIAGVLAFSVSARTSEIGIRMSLGASRGSVLRMVLREGGVLLLAGLVIGLAAATLAARVLEGLLFRVPPHDPVTFGLVAVTMAAVGFIACWVPALRAARIDPATMMRCR
jgi:putative ABC transport system permease protein